MLRVTLNVGAVTANFHAVTHAPLATVNTIGFARPAVLVLLAMLVLGERPGVARWIATAIGFLGVLVVLDPRDMAVDDGLLAAVAAMILGSAAVITMRRSTEGPMALMVWYTVAMSAMTAVPAFLLWAPVRGEDWPMLLLVGTLAQLGQYCFIRAHRAADVATLAPLGYLSLVLSAAAGWLIFAEPITGSTLAGAAIIVASTWWLRRR
jgi:drug/metabolite transporter (DMT)-like permease